jgi:hypothetical protein
MNNNEIETNIYDAMVSVNGNIMFVTKNGGFLMYNDSNVSSSTDLRFFDCNNVVICVNQRVNHVLLYNCHSVTIIVSKGLISGKIDIIHSSEITAILRSNPTAIVDEFGNGFVAYYIDLSHSVGTKIYIEKLFLRILHIMAVNTIQNQIITFGLRDLHSYQIENNLFVLKRVYLDYNYFNNNYVYILRDNLLECFDDKLRGIPLFNKEI